MEFSNMSLEYMTGFGNDFQTEALPGALPQGQNSPQICPYKLYAEQLSGSPFTAPRNINERSWLYRIRPSVKHTGKYQKENFPFWKTAPSHDPENISLGQFRWDPFPFPKEQTEFISGVRTLTTAGDVNTHNGMAASIYSFNKSMTSTVFTNSDAEMLFVPETGSIVLFTEMGKMHISPGEIAVLPRGMMVKISLIDKFARGYICENYGAKLTLPDRGPIGANCLANPRDFRTPVAAFEDIDENHISIVKWCGAFFSTSLKHSPLDVVAWHGNYIPYSYDLRTFSPVSAVSFDHPDPSIYSVLTAPSESDGTANIDFVIFPERWAVAEHTFRPPWYHRNIMSEFMGLVYGQYDAKPEGFVPGGASLHNMMLPHGPDADAFENASKAELKPVKITNTLAFMFESRFPQHITKFAMESDSLQSDYVECWSEIKKHFDGKL